MSKITKIKATKKNCNEKGGRPIRRGLNPHSKGLFFFKSLKDFIDNIRPNIKIIKDKQKICIIKKKIFNIF